MDIRIFGIQGDSIVDGDQIEQKNDHPVFILQ